MPVLSKRTHMENPARRNVVARFQAPLFGLASLLVLIGAATAGNLPFSAQAQIAVRNQGYIPYTEAPINYRTQEPSDPVALLQKQLDAGKANLTYDADHGYLRSALELLDVRADSQTLVFSKTSFQYPHISPDHPRALYYNDDVYIGAVHDGKAIEVISFDPMQGAMFYVLDEHKVDKPVFQRAELDCTQCHIAPGTRGIPGVFLQSVFTTPTGALAPRLSAFITDQKSPLKERWGGWYVTGDLGGPSMVNSAVVASATPVDKQAAPVPPQLNPFAKAFDASAYLAPGSDQVALLALGHQTQMHNLITLTNYRTRIALHGLSKASGVAPVLPDDPVAALEALPEEERQQIKGPAEQLLRYMLFINETPLGGLDAQKIVAASPFAREFSARGIRDSKGRSLRDFDLHDRIFRYRCSYLIYNVAFDALPQPAKGYVYHRLFQVLSGEDQSADFAQVTAQDREDILSILLETKPGLPAEWQAYAKSSGLHVTASPPHAAANK